MLPGFSGTRILEVHQRATALAAHLKVGISHGPILAPTSGALGGVRPVRLKVDAQVLGVRLPDELGGIVQGGEAARPAGLFVAAIALHPLVGPETAAVAVAATGVALLVEMRRPRDLRPLLTGARARRLLIVTMVCVVTTAVFWGRGYVRTLGTEQFIQILAYTRTPHHYIPSLFAAVFER